MTIKQGLLTDREYIILLEAKIRMLERRFSKASSGQPRIDPDKADAAWQAVERLGGHYDYSKHQKERI